MLRCTLASIIPLMLSEKYQNHRMLLFEKHEPFFHDIIRHQSYYILRDLPIDILDRFFTPIAGNIINKQNKSGLWKIKDGERVSFDVLSAVRRVGKLPDLAKENSLKYDLYRNIRLKTDFYSLLIKKDFFNKLSNDDEHSMGLILRNFLASQSENGSWNDTVIATGVNVNHLLMYGVNPNAPAIQKGVQFLFRNLNERMEGMHSGKPYGFVGRHMISTVDRDREFHTAVQLKPEWIPRNVCYGHLAVIQNAVALQLLIQLGFEADQQVEKALDNLFEIDSEYNGFCKSNIHKKYIR